MFFSFLAHLKKRLIVYIPLSMLLGIIFGYWYHGAMLRQAILPLTFLMVYPMMVAVPMKQLFSHGDAKVQLVTQLINFVIIPLFGLLIGRLFFPGELYIQLGILLACLVPTSGMTISWTGFAKGNMSAAIKMTIIGLLLGSVATPFYLLFFLGADITIPLGNIFMQIATVVLLPLVLGQLTQYVLIRRYGVKQFKEQIKPKITPVALIGVLGIVFVAMALKSAAILAHPLTVLWYFVPLVLLYLGNFVISTIIGRIWFVREDAIALVYGSVMRNLSIALAIAMTSFGERGADIALIISAAYIVQVQLAAWYVKYTDVFFGKQSLWKEILWRWKYRKEM